METKPFLIQTIFDDLARRVRLGRQSLVRGVCQLEPTLVVIGVNYRSAPVEVRERFWISESRRYEALVRLARSEAIEEVAVLATSNRTEFILWTRDASIAANSVLNFLTAEYGLRLGEWKHFYRLIGEPALVHLFKVTSSLDSIILGEPEIGEQMKDA